MNHHTPKTTIAGILARTTLAASILVAGLATTSKADVIINEVYAGGGSTSAGTAYTRDFVELYNTGPTAVSLSNWRVTYASATGNFGTNDVIKFEIGAFIAPGDYLLLVSGGIGSAGVPVPNANYYNGTSSGASLGAAGGSVKLFDANNVSIDTVGYGNSNAADASMVPKIETTAAAAATSTAVSLSRTGFADTNNNSADFTSQTPSPTAGTMSNIPEPASIGLLSMGAVMLLRRRRQA